MSFDGGRLQHFKFETKMGPRIGEGVKFHPFNPPSCAATVGHDSWNYLLWDPVDHRPITFILLLDPVDLVSKNLFCRDILDILDPKFCYIVGSWRF